VNVTDAPMFVKAFFLVLWSRCFLGLLRCGHDRDGPLAVEGRLLSGHEVSRLERVPGRPADRFKASSGCGSRYEGQAAPGSCAR
jgi:hypothetical protein